jgi:tetratricopeptide (TPR) repeat protein
MRKLLFAAVVAAALCSTTLAQIGRRVTIQAGTPEDKALQQIGATTDPAQKIELLHKFMAEFGQSDAALAAFELYIAHYAAEKNFAKVFESAEKALAFDPENFAIAFTALRIAQEQNDHARLFHYGQVIGGILTRFRASAAPAGTEAEAWEGQKRAVLDELRNNINYTEYSFFSTAYGLKDPAAKAAAIEHFLGAFPDSQYAAMGATLAADAYRQAGQGPRMVTFAEKVLARDPNHYGLLVQLADYWADGKEQLEKAEQYATKALSLLAQAPKPESLTPEQWTQQKNLQTGLAYAAIGQAQVHTKRDAPAVESFKSAAPLLKPYNFYYGRCLYLWGFALARQKKSAEARPVLTEAAALDSPYKPLAQESLAKLGPAKAGKAAKKRP